MGDNMSSITKEDLQHLEGTVMSSNDPVAINILQRLIEGYASLTTDHPTLDCPVCGDVAFTSDTNYFTDGEGEVCESCGHPGSVVVEEDGDKEVYWQANDELCDGCIDCANFKLEKLTNRLAAIAKLAAPLQV
jgi:hypothetical protein